ncbi:MAG: hypothetical protein UY18_C0043G0001, partial [Microgenomates group bacterium GW2011_GWF2_47_9]
DIRAWIDTQSDERYKVPTEFCASDTQTVIGFDKPGNNSKIDTNDVEVRIKVISSKEIEWVKLYLDGTEVESFVDRNITTTLTINTGVHELSAKVKTKDGEEKQTAVKIGVKTDPNATPSPSPTPTLSPSLTPTPSPSSLPL